MHSMSDNLADSGLKERSFFYIKVPTMNKFIPLFLGLVESFTKSVGFNQNDVHNIKLSVDEATANIIKHSYKNTSGLITGEFSFIDGTLRIVLIHKGIAFDLSKYSEPDIQNYIKERKRGGFGIYLMKNLMDNILYTTKDGIHKIILIKEKK